jgi:hypothetical protein
VSVHIMYRGYNTQLMVEISRSKCKSDYVIPEPIPPPMAPPRWYTQSWVPFGAVVDRC